MKPAARRLEPASEVDSGTSRAALCLVASNGGVGEWGRVGGGGGGGRVLYEQMTVTIWDSGIDSRKLI